MVSSILALMKNTTRNMGVQVFLWYPDLDSFVNIPSSYIAGICSSSLFNFFWELLY